MKTKSLLLTALLTAAGSSGLMAQVYSLNIVGYVNQAIPAGFSLVACQLQNSTDNKLTSLFTTAPDGTTVYKWSNSQNRYFINDFADGSWEGDDLNMTMNPGEGVWFKAPTPFTNTFVGQIALSSSVPIPHGFSIISSAVPQAGTLTALQYGATEGDTTYQWSPAQNKYIINDFADGAWEGDTAGGPTVAVGEGFWLKNPNASAETWARTFNVGP